MAPVAIPVPKPMSLLHINMPQNFSSALNNNVTEGWLEIDKHYSLEMYFSIVDKDSEASLWKQSEYVKQKPIPNWGRYCYCLMSRIHGNTELRHCYLSRFRTIYVIRWVAPDSIPPRQPSNLPAHVTFSGSKPFKRDGFLRKRRHENTI